MSGDTAGHGRATRSRHTADPLGVPCTCSYCLEAHARAGMVVDTARVKEMLLDLLPRVLAGDSVEALAPRQPWPPSTADAANGTGLWWDVAS